MNIKKPKISVIIPIYNVGELLHKCIESIQNQLLDDIEIILINDGSTDNSAVICDDIASKDKRIQVIHKINEGASSARNVGISISNGEYIGFVDADDYIHEEMYRKMYKKAKENNCDIVMCDAKIEYENKVEIDTISLLNNSCIIEKREISPDLLMGIAGSMWKCIYRRDLLINNKVICPVGIKLSEDRIFNIKAFGNCNNLYYLKEALYTQKVRKNSATTKYYDNMLSIVVNSRNIIFRSLEELWNDSENYKKVYEKQNINSVYQCINNEFHNESNKNVYQKYRAIDKIVKNIHVRDMINRVEDNNMKINLLRLKASTILCIIAFIKNRK